MAASVQQLAEAMDFSLSVLAMSRHISGLDYSSCPLIDDDGTVVALIAIHYPYESRGTLLEEALDALIVEEGGNIRYGHCEDDSGMSLLVSKPLGLEVRGDHASSAA